MNTYYNHEEQFLCQFCDKTFGAAFSLTQHQEGTYHGDCRWKMYKNTPSDPFLSKLVQQIHDKFVDLEIGQRCRTKYVVEKILTTILRHEGNRGRFSLLPDQEGSYTTRLKVGIPDEFDYSVSLLLTEQPKLSCEALEVRYEDDIDFAHVSKARRRFDRYRPLRKDCQLQNLSDGYVGVKPQGKDLRLFRQSIMETSLIPYELLRSFHSFFQKAVDERGFGNANVSVNRLGNGPAIALTIEYEEFRHNISVDITPKIYIDNGPETRQNAGYRMDRSTRSTDVGFIWFRKETNIGKYRSLIAKTNYYNTLMTNVMVTMKPKPYERRSFELLKKC